MKQEDKEPEGGIYFERKVFHSKAYLALSKNGRQALLAFLDARKQNPAFKKDTKKGFRSHRFIDLDKITVTYNEFKEIYGIPVQSVPRAIDELLAKGFIEIKHQGGAGEHDKSVYALIEEYRRWEAGKVFRERTRDVRRGYQGRKVGVMDPRKQNSRSKTETHTRSKTETFGTQKASQG